MNKKNLYQTITGDEITTFIQMELHWLSTGYTLSIILTNCHWIKLGDSFSGLPVNIALP